MKKLLSPAVIFLLAILTVISSVATTGYIQKTLLYDNIRITLDGTELIPTDVNGTYVEPFIIDGTTYLPVRGIANSLGLGVDWDGTTNTVILTTDPVPTDNDKTVIPDITSSAPGEPIDISDVDISKVIYYTPEGEQVGYIDSNGEKVVPEYIVKINGIPVSLEEFRYPYLSIRSAKDNGDISLWSEGGELAESDRAAVEKDTIDYLKQTTLYQLMAVKYDLPLTAEELGNVDDTIRMTKDSMNAEGSTYTYEQALEDAFLTHNLYRYTNTIYSLANKIYNYLYLGENAPLRYTPEEALKALEEKEYVRAQHILIQFTEQADTQSKAAAYAKAQEALARALAGEDFMTLVEEYNDDPGMDTYGKDGYYFTRGYMVEEFEEATYALDKGEISGIVETSYGYHIIKRLPLEADYVFENAESLLGEVYSEDFDKRLFATYETMIVEYAPEYGIIFPDTLH